MRYKMIFGQTLFSFFKKGRRDLHIREVRFLNRDMNGEVNGSTRLLYDEETETIQRYVNGSAPIASLSDDMVCFLAEVSRCFGRLSGEQSWEKDVWLCVDTEVIPETGADEMTQEERDEILAEYERAPLIPGPGTAERMGCYGAGH